MAVRPDTPTMAMSPQRRQSAEIWPIENTAKEPEIIKGYHHTSDTPMLSLGLQPILKFLN